MSLIILWSSLSLPFPNIDLQTSSVSAFMLIPVPFCRQGFRVCIVCCMPKLFQCVCVIVHCSQHIQGEYEVQGGSELIYRSQYREKVQMWNMTSFERDYVIKDWQKRGETRLHSVCIHLLDCSCEAIAMPSVVWGEHRHLPPPHH